MKIDYSIDWSDFGIMFRIYKNDKRLNYLYHYLTIDMQIS